MSITKHNLNPINKKQEAINLITRSIKQELLWTEQEVEQLTNKVLIDYELTKEELITIFIQADFIFIDKPITKLEKLFNKTFIQREALEVFKERITGGQQWRQSPYMKQLDQDQLNYLEQLYIDYTNLQWQLQAEYHKVEEELKAEHKALMERLSLNHPTYYKNDQRFKDFWQELNIKAKIF